MGWLSGSPSVERSRSLLRCAWWRAILSGPSQFLRELHFIEALGPSPPEVRGPSQFLRELHFIEASASHRSCSACARSQFLRELHFTEAGHRSTCQH